jgi:cytochrome c-type biogenesis protein CcmF
MRNPLQSGGSGETVDLGAMQATLKSIGEVQGPNFQAVQAQFSVRRGNRIDDLVSERRFYPVSRNQTTEAGIGVAFLGNAYLAIGDEQRDAKGPGIVVRLYHHPMVGWIWFGGLMMALGGAASLADRRFRIGAPTRAPLPLGVTRGMVPAE